MENEYLKLIFEGWAKDVGKLDNYFYREFKKAQKENIPPDEFILHLTGTLKKLDQKRIEPYHKKLERWNNFQSQESEKGNICKVPMPEDNSFSSLLILTKGIYSGQICKTDIEYIELSIKKAYERIKNERVNDFSNPDFEIKWVDTFVETYNKEVTPERIRELESGLSKIENSEERIEYLRKQKLLYLQKISPESLAVSGMTSTNFPPGASLFFDRYIELEIEKQKNQNIIKNSLPNQTETKTDKIKAPVFKPKLFKDLLNKPELIDKCLNLLRETDKPCISDEDKYLRNKGVFVIWFIALQDKKMFNQIFTNDFERAETLNFNFEGLRISESLFRQKNKRATENYKKHFELEISAIKH